jgi:hypothetical protein
MDKGNCVDIVDYSDHGFIVLISEYTDLLAEIVKQYDILAKENETLKSMLSKKTQSREYISNFPNYRGLFRSNSSWGYRYTLEKAREKISITSNENSIGFKPIYLIVKVVNNMRQHGVKITIGKIIKKFKERQILARFEKHK